MSHELEFAGEILVDYADRNILVVDDCTAITTILEHHLRCAGYTVAVATNGQEAWEATQVTQFDMILTDHQMPKMSGVELCETLRRTESYAETPIVMITSKRFELDLPRLQEALHLSGVLMKPFSSREVLQVVEDCVDHLSL